MIEKQSLSTGDIIFKEVIFYHTSSQFIHHWIDLRQGLKNNLS